MRALAVLAPGTSLDLADVASYPLARAMDALKAFSSGKLGKIVVTA